MTKVEVLIEGYAHPNSDGTYTASPTCTLINEDGKLILVDPGCNSKRLLNSLNDRGLTTKNIDMIFLSHYHLDHVLNIRLFPETDIYDGAILWQDDEETFYNDKIPHTKIEVIATPGHSTEQFSLKIIDDTLGKVCIAQDVFWWEDGKQKSDTVKDLMNLIDPFANDLVALKDSREKVLEWADYIIPGHGRMFKTPSK
jgi:glyoxylase-like metal-dependent hydrolase (beta-lactamase superfamily II)